MNVQTMGTVARQILARSQDACLLGVTSRGIYLRAGSDWVLYLTGEGIRGPLTLNLDEMPGNLQEKPGDLVAFSKDSLWFPISGVRIAVTKAAEWRAPPPADRVLSPAEISARLVETSKLVQIPAGLMDARSESALHQALQGQQAEMIAGLLNPLFGRGPGLTPAGDDLALGLLLALNRWKNLICPAFPVEILGALIIQEARIRTTTLSANLIECAAQGQADERLVTGLDGLVTGAPDIPVCAVCFNRWGNTSGASAFWGIKLALTAC